jgi:glycosyltransferase involved in cell wall biosynthesis
MSYCKKIYDTIGIKVVGIKCDTCNGCDSESMRKLAINICVNEWNNNPHAKQSMFTKIVSLVGEMKAKELLGMYVPIKSDQTVIVVCCKNRYDVLKETMPSIQESGPLGLVFVEYNDPEKSGEYVEGTYPNTDVVRVEDGDPHYAYSRAMNIGAAFAIKQYPTAKNILFVDADVVLKPNVLGLIEEIMPHVLRVRKTHKEGHEGRGLIGATVKDFLTVGGWDETFDPWWGYRDINLIERLMVSGLDYREVIGLDVEIPHRLPIEEKEKTAKLWLQNKDQVVLSREGWSATVRHRSEQVQLSWPILSPE